MMRYGSQGGSASESRHACRVGGLLAFVDIPVSCIYADMRYNRCIYFLLLLS
jgi:hypothetical protein